MAVWLSGRSRWFRWLKDSIGGVPRFGVPRDKKPHRNAGVSGATGGGAGFLAGNFP